MIDNLKTGVIKPDLYDPPLNRAYAEMAEHYGCLIDPARAEKPRDKPRVERMMPYVRDSFWRGRSFGSVIDMQAARGRAGAPQVAGHAGAPQPGRRAAAGLFEAVEEPALLAAAAGAVRAGPLAGAARSRRTATCIVEQGALLACRGCTSASGSTPGSPRRLVEIFADGQLIKTWPRRRTGPAHRPGRLPTGEDRVLHAHPGLVPLAAPRSSVEHVTELVVGLLADHALHHLRAAQGIIGLAEQVQPRAAGCRLPPRARSGGPVLPHGQGHPRCRRRQTPRPAAADQRRVGGDAGAPARPGRACSPTSTGSGDGGAATRPATARRRRGGGAA